MLGRYASFFFFWRLFFREYVRYDVVYYSFSFFIDIAFY